MSKEYLVKFEDDYGNSRTIYARANNEYEAQRIAESKAQNCYSDKFDEFDLESTYIRSVYQKRSCQFDEYVDSF